MTADLLSRPEILVIVVWLAVCGAAIGSFLNVVVYRLPRGLGLSYPASHCPACKHPIRWRDNVPVLGWILLGGRCRDCGIRISIRYPVVEAITATLFLIVATEGWTQGANLPERLWLADSRLFSQSLSSAEIWGIVGYHLLLVATLWAMALVEFDGQRLPARIAVPALLVGGILPMVWPVLRPVPAMPMESDWPAGLIDGIAGLAVGLTIGFAAWRLMRNPARNKERCEPTRAAGEDSQRRAGRQGRLFATTERGAGAGACRPVPRLASGAGDRRDACVR